MQSVGARSSYIHLILSLAYLNVSRLEHQECSFICHPAFLCEDVSSIFHAFGYLNSSGNGFLPTLRYRDCRRADLDSIKADRSSLSSHSQSPRYFSSVHSVAICKIERLQSFESADRCTSMIETSDLFLADSFFGAYLSSQCSCKFIAKLNNV